MICVDGRVCMVRISVRSPHCSLGGPHFSDVWTFAIGGSAEDIEDSGLWGKLGGGLRC